MTYDFIKYEGCGNDYIYIDCFGSEPTDEDKSKISLKLSDRHFGVGGDGVVFICRSGVADGNMRMFNADGSEGKMCGNAIRCVGKYLYEKRGVKKDVIAIETQSGVKTLKLSVENGLVTAARVDMGKPILKPELVPAKFPGDKAIGVKAALDHCVIFTSGVEKMDIETLGRIIENHEVFPDRVNVEFAEVLSRHRVRMRVWERGSGETLACGTGACATVVAMVENGLADRGSDVKVELTGGTLTINYDETVYMTGAATEVFEGRVTL